METLDICPLCGSVEIEHIRPVKDHFLSQEVFELTHCTECDLLFTNPRPTRSEISQYYQSAEYISHSNKTQSITSLLYKTVRSYTLRKKYELLTKFIDNNSTVKHLDYGCGTGHFIQYTSRKGWNSYGFEPDHTARNSSEKEVKTLIYSNLKHISTNYYDVITLFHVLEHVHDLNQTLEHLISRLTNNGIIVLALPNHEAYDASYYQDFWAGYDVPRHLYHFNRNSVKHLAKIYGLKIAHTEPMKFDSFYVSMLSEKYKGNNASLIKGLKTGLISNKSALKTKDFSSIIYILRK